MKKTFTKVIPTMPASIQKAAYADTEILFDWHEVKGFKGSAVEGIQVIVRGTDGADQTMVAIDLLFATSHIREEGEGISVDQVPPTLGTTGAAVDTFQWKNNLVGYVPIAAGDFIDGDLVVLNIATKSGLNIPVSGDLYVAAIAKGALDFRSTVQVSTETATNTTDVVVKTTSALTTFAPGDVLHDEDDLVIGTVKSVTDATNLVLTENCASVSAVNKDLYNIHPIQLMLSGVV
jgi:hypothetical protein|tara:strand:- start:278 stop:979 length:702 start_codon:yes stop_codon:yes gene_type:complete